MFGPSYRRGDVCYPNYAGISKNLDDIQNFVPDPEDILLCSYPKSGTHWAFEILNLVAISPDRSKYTQMPVLNIEVIGVEGIRSFPSPKVIQTHLPYDALPPSMQNHPKIVYVMRNPKDQLVSLYHHYSATLGTKALSWAQFFEAMRNEEGVEYGSWIRNSLQWWSACRQRTNVLFLFYEEIMQDHEAAVKRLSKFVGVHLEDDEVRQIVEMTSFNRMKHEKQPPEQFYTWFKRDFSIYRNGQIGNWKAYFTEDQDQSFNQRYNEVLQRVDATPPLRYGLP